MTISLEKFLKGENVNCGPVSRVGISQLEGLGGEEEAKEEQPLWLRGIKRDQTQALLAGGHNHLCQILQTRPVK